MSNGTKTTWQLIMIPALISLVITIIRLAGELQHGSSRLFNSAAGGPLAIVGIVWLVPIFGIYFAVKLAHQEGGPESKGKALGLNILGIVIVVCSVYLEAKEWEYSAYVLMLISWIFFALSWGALTKTLLAYGYTARIPVLIVMLIATARNWTTHYSAYPPPLDKFGYLGKIWHGAFLPQMIFWITFTVAVGGLFGVITSFFAKKSGVISAAA